MTNAVLDQKPIFFEFSIACVLLLNEDLKIVKRFQKNRGLFAVQKVLY